MNANRPPLLLGQVAEPPPDVECDLDLKNSSRKVWLVKVPEFVAKTWRDATSNDGADGDASASGKCQLGSLKLSNNNTSFMLSLNPELNEGSKQLCEDGLAELDMVLQSGGAAGKDRDQMLVAIRDDAGKKNKTTKRVAAAAAIAEEDFDEDDEVLRFVDGVVQHRLGVDPTSLMEKRKYSKVSRSRFTAAAAASRHDEHKEKRKIQVMTDAKIVDIRKPIGVDDRRQKAGGKGQFQEKRVAMESNDLLAILFRLFSKQSRWTFVQLQKETAQPTQHLKAVLGEIARLNKAGPYKGLWELNKESAVHT